MPLAATWLMMAIEGPFLAAIIARLPNPTFNLAAFGVTLAFAFVVEAPVVMLMAATTALAKDGPAFRRLRLFAYGLGALVTGVLLFVLLPPVFRFLALEVIAVPERVASLTYGGLWILLPWPAAVGYRRFYQGLLIREGRTRLVAVGTVLRVLFMTGTALALYRASSLPGNYVAAAALSAGVIGEAIASRWMARRSVKRVLGKRASSDRLQLTLGRIIGFYAPLALTSILGFAVHPLLTFFMGRAPLPVISLAVFPVVNALGFLFRATSLAFQEVAITLLGDRYEHLGELRTFATALGVAASALLGLIAVTPLARVWFESISGLSPELAGYALLPTLLLAPIPFLSAVLALLRGILVTAHQTRPITLATAMEVTVIAIVFPVLSEGLDVFGATAAAGAFLLRRAMSTLWLAPRAVRAMG